MSKQFKRLCVVSALGVEYNFILWNIDPDLSTEEASSVMPNCNGKKKKFSIKFFLTVEPTEKKIFFPYFSKIFEPTNHLDGRDSNHFSGSAVANGGHTVKSPVFKRDKGSAPSPKSVSATSSTNKGNTHSSNSV